MDFKNFDFEQMRKDSEERKLQIFFDAFKKKNPEAYESLMESMKKNFLLS